jgi:hypothetical protein
MEAICSSETSIDTQRTTRRYIPEGGTNHSLIYVLFIYLFMVRLTMPSAAQAKWRPVLGWSMNKKLEGMWKEVVVA